MLYKRYFCPKTGKEEVFERKTKTLKLIEVTEGNYDTVPVELIVFEDENRTEYSFNVPAEFTKGECIPKAECWKIIEKGFREIEEKKPNYDCLDVENITISGYFVPNEDGNYNVYYPRLVSAPILTKREYYERAHECDEDFMREFIVY